MEKRCPSCKSLLLVSCFGKDSKTVTGYRSWCKACCKKSRAKNSKESSKRYRESQKRKGLCQYCSKQPLLNRGVCEKHYVVLVAKQGLNRADNKTVEELIFRFRSNPFCPYTGEALTLGVNAHLDHIKSKKNHPELSNDINNVEWISELANLSKNGLNKDDFIKLCKTIVDRFS